MKKFPKTTPADSPEYVAGLQQELLADAEKALGKLKTLIRIEPPRFQEPGPGPIIQFNHAEDAVWALLSSVAAGDWRALVEELGHEVTHLLDARRGAASWLEEGVAIAFSARSMIACKLKVHYSEHVNFEKAFRLANNLPNGAIPFGKKVRETFGSLTGPTASDLISIAPKLDLQTAEKLVKLFPPV
ncbi:hypothetical protein [Caballeronia sp. dw_276]|uniref:hypothetical protein n=1 Tax=Caballeronia sp. dw_276 TaxID=2719795 RepID=UPI001BD444BB|nr:hypothetical protein [Caballeronia sp. dw_276]